MRTIVFVLQASERELAEGKVIPHEQVARELREIVRFAADDEMVLEVAAEAGASVIVTTTCTTSEASRSSSASRPHAGRAAHRDGG